MFNDSDSDDPSTRFEATVKDIQAEGEGVIGLVVALTDKSTKSGRTVKRAVAVLDVHEHESGLVHCELDYDKSGLSHEEQMSLSAVVYAIVTGSSGSLIGDGIVVKVDLHARRRRRAIPPDQLPPWMLN